MKKTELTKSLGLKIRGRMQQAPIPQRFGVAAKALPDRREQRKLDQAAGLVPFAVKLHQELVGRLNDLAARDGVSLNELTAQLLAAGLAQAPAKKATTTAAKTPAKKAAKKAAQARKTAPAKEAAAEPGKAARAARTKAA